jgi:hypothetical protein
MSRAPDNFLTTWVGPGFSLVFPPLVASVYGYVSADLLPVTEETGSWLGPLCLSTATIIGLLPLTRSKFRLLRVLAYLLYFPAMFWTSLFFWVFGGWAANGFT